MKLSPRITTVASSAVANLCLIPETGGEGEGADRRGVKLKPFGKWRTHAAESNQCAMTRAGARHRDGRVEVCVCANRADERGVSSKAKIHESLSHKRVHYLTPLPSDSR